MTAVQWMSVVYIIGVIVSFPAFLISMTKWWARKFPPEHDCLLDNLTLRLVCLVFSFTWTGWALVGIFLGLIRTIREIISEIRG